MSILRSLLALPLLVAVVHAGAPTACNTVVGKRETLTLAADLGPCDGPSSSTAGVVVDGGTLDLNGRTITCADTDVDGDIPQGVVLTGKKSKVVNGTIVGCANGIFITGDGKHQVQGVTVQGSIDDGIDFTEDAGKCKITDVTLSGNADDGIEMDSDKNKVTNAVVTGSGEDGIDITGTADKNKVTNARCDDNGDDGIEVAGIKNKVKNSTANNNVEDGVDFGNSKNKLTGGSAQGNGTFDLNDCTGNKIKGFTFTTGSADCF
jgi:hypothetical protein